MRSTLLPLAAAGLLGTASAAPVSGSKTCANPHHITSIQLGPRPYYLIDKMQPGPLKNKLASCQEMSFKPTAFSIAHRGGGTMLMPEETTESIMAGTRMGAGIQECDVSFTSDLELVCRHDNCDLHYTTNILDTPLAAKCTQPFNPFDAATGKAASAKCCTSDITLAEFKSLCGKMEGQNTKATTAKEFIKGTPPYRTDLYAQCGTVMSHKEYIKLVDALGLKFTPELKTPQVPMPFNSSVGGEPYTQEAYAQQMIDEYKEAGIDPSRVYVQSFKYDDILYWLEKEPEFAEQACFLDERADSIGIEAATANLTEFAKAGVKIMAPALPHLVTEKDGKIVPSMYAIKAKELGLKLVTWSLERSGILSDGSHGGYYYASIAKIINNDGDVFNLVDVLAQEVGVLGIFSDWSATVTYYANCFGLFP